MKNIRTYGTVCNPCSLIFSNLLHSLYFILDFCKFPSHSVVINCIYCCGVCLVRCLLKFFDGHTTFLIAAMVNLTESICWKVVAKTSYFTGIGLVIYQKPVSSSCYESRKENKPPLCDQNQGKNMSW